MNFICHGFVVLAFLALTFQTISSLKMEQYVSWGSEKVRNILEAGKIKTPYLKVTDIMDTIAQNCANDWGTFRAERNKNSNTPMLEASGLNAIFVDGDKKTNDQDEFIEMFDWAIVNQILQVVKAKEKTAQFLIEIGIGYIEEKLSSLGIFRKATNLFGITSALNVHLVIVLRFTRKTDNYIAEGLMKTVRTEILFGAIGKMETAKMDIGNIVTNKVAYLWATRYADTQLQPNITSTSKDFWITCLACSVKRADVFILSWGVPNFICMDPVSKYEYDPKFNKVEAKSGDDREGYFVVVTTFPEDFTPEEQDALVRRIPQLSLEKPCPQAATLAFMKTVSQSSIGKKTSSVDNKPVLVSQDEYRIIFNFPVEIGKPGEIPRKDPRKIPDKHFESVAEQVKTQAVYGLDKRIVGAGFRRLLERDVETNETRSIIVLVLRLDKSKTLLKPATPAEPSNVASTPAIQTTPAPLTPRTTPDTSSTESREAENTNTQVKTLNPSQISSAGVDRVIISTERAKVFVLNQVNTWRKQMLLELKELCQGCGERIGELVNPPILKHVDMTETSLKSWLSQLPPPACDSPVFSNKADYCWISIGISGNQYSASLTLLSISIEAEIVVKKDTPPTPVSPTQGVDHAQLIQTIQQPKPIEPTKPLPATTKQITQTTWIASDPAVCGSSKKNLSIGRRTLEIYSSFSGPLSSGRWGFKLAYEVKDASSIAQSSNGANMVRIDVKFFDGSTKCVNINMTGFSLEKLNATWVADKLQIEGAF